MRISANKRGIRLDRALVITAVFLLLRSGKQLLCARAALFFARRQEPPAARFKHNGRIAYERRGSAQQRCNKEGAPGETHSQRRVDKLTTCVKLTSRLQDRARKLARRSVTRTTSCRCDSSSESALHLTDQQKVRLGTCAWSYDSWRGAFYPRDLPQELWLEFYARHLSTVEVDATFYAAPPPLVVRRWVEETPAAFRFACKLPREITHACRLRDCAAELNSFLRAIEPLAPKLQVLLVQLPPSFTPKDGRSVLHNFLKQLPRDYRFAIEFRHAGWHRPAIIRLLEKFRVCWVWADTSPLNERNLAPFEFMPITTDFLYVRLLGDYATKYGAEGQQMHRYAKLLWKREAALDNWALRIQRHLGETRSVFIYANNHFEGFAPETCQRLAQRLGFELTLPPSEATASTEPGQLDLFADPA